MATEITSALLQRVLLKHEVEEFLYHEAKLLDERRFHEWLDLLADDVRYRMPMRRNVPIGELERESLDAPLDMAWFDEGKDTLEKRVGQILTGKHWAEEPPSRLRHLISNVQIVDATAAEIEPEQVTVECGFLVYRNRQEDETDIFVGQRRDVLRKQHGQWRIASRDITLDQNVLLAKNLTFFF